MLKQKTVRLDTYADEEDPKIAADIPGVLLKGCPVEVVGRSTKFPGRVKVRYQDGQGNSHERWIWEEAID